MIVIARPVHGRHRPAHIVRLPHGEHRMWTVHEQPVKRRRRSRRELMQLSVAELVQGARRRAVRLPWWRVAGAWALAYVINVFASEPGRLT